jgi:berberine-like enzyme
VHKRCTHGQRHCIQHPNFLGGHADSIRVRAAYREDDYRRLQTIKAGYEPANTFSINHNIPPGR